MSVLSVTSEPAWLAVYRLTSTLTLESSVTLEPDNRPSLMSESLALSSLDSSSLTILTSFLGAFRKAMDVPLSVCSRVASIPAATSSGSTSLIRRQCHL